MKHRIMTSTQWAGTCPRGHALCVRARCWVEGERESKEPVALPPELVQAEIDRILALGARRRDEAKDPAIRGMRPAGIDWLRSDEINRVEELRALLPRETLKEIQNPVARKRAERVSAAKRTKARKTERRSQGGPR
jgi:hypothetical protein